MNQVLIAARALIADPAHWTKRAIARNSMGDALQGSRHADAVCWCLQGAVRASTTSRAEFIDAMRILQLAMVEHDVAAWNDFYRTEHADVLALLDKAIAS